MIILLFFTLTIKEVIWYNNNLGFILFISCLPLCSKASSQFIGPTRALDKTTRVTWLFLDTSSVCVMINTL